MIDKPELLAVTILKSAGVTITPQRRPVRRDTS
jgi:hypothetical protein